MSERNEKSQKVVRLGTNGEDYGNWMSDPVFYMVCGLTALAALLAVLSFAVLLCWRYCRLLCSIFLYFASCL